MARAFSVCLTKRCIIDDKDWNQLKNRQANKSKKNWNSLFSDRKTSKQSYKNICDGNRPDQRNLAIYLCRMANVSMIKPASLSDSSKFENVLGVRIAVLSSDIGNKFIRAPSNELRNKEIIYLYIVGNESTKRFHAVTSPNAFYSCSYFCQTCLQPYHNKNRHRCESCCLVCQSSSCRETEGIIT